MTKIAIFLLSPKYAPKFVAIFNRRITSHRSRKISVVTPNSSPLPPRGGVQIVIVILWVVWIIKMTIFATN